MIRPAWNNTELFSEYVQLLLQLHALIADGKGEEEEAESIRDQMDYPWKNLGSEQLALVDGLSADLYSLDANRVEPKVKVHPDKRFSEAVERGNWQLVLELLREAESELQQAHVAFIRGVCWIHLEQPDVAISFLRQAARLKTLEPNDEIWLLQALIQAERIDEALPRVREIIQNENDPILLLMAAKVMFVLASQTTVINTEENHRIVIQTAERGLRLAEKQTSDELLQAFCQKAYLHLALSYEHIGDRAAALKACSAALKASLDGLSIDLHNETAEIALMLFGFLNYQDCPRAEVEVVQNRIRRHLFETERHVQYPAALVSQTN